MGAVTTHGFLSKSLKRNVDESQSVLRHRAALGGNNTNVLRDNLNKSPKTDTTAADDKPRKKQRSMRPVRTEGNVRAAKSTSWTSGEDCALRNAVDIHKARNWKLIAESVPTRTEVQCLDRWQKVLNPILVKGYWTNEEDDRMIELVQLFGHKRWAAIARCLPGRNGKQCRERWCNHLDPKISRDAWTEAEDMLLFLAHSKFGNKWAEISKLLPGRSDNGVKNRWNTSVKKKAGQMVEYTKFLDLESPAEPTQENLDPRRTNLMSPVQPTPPHLDARRSNSISPVLPTPTHLDARRSNLMSPVQPTQAHLDARRPNLMSPVQPAPTHLDVRRSNLMSPVQPAPTLIDAGGSNLKSPVQPTQAHLDARRPNLMSPVQPTRAHLDAGRPNLMSPVQPTQAYLDARRPNFTPGQNHCTIQPTYAHLDARRPNFTSGQDHRTLQPTQAHLDARRPNFTPGQDHRTLQPTQAHLDARRPNFTLGQGHWSLQPTQAHLDARRPNFTPGQDRRTVQVEQKENCEVCQGFKSYSKTHQ